MNGDAKKETAFAACARSQTKAFNLHLSIQIALSKLNVDDATAVGAFCKVKEAGWDAAKLTAALTCINKGPSQMEAARFQFLNQRLNAMTDAISMVTATSPQFTESQEGAGHHTPQTQTGSATHGVPAAKTSTTVTYQQGQHVGSSAFRTNSTCKLSKAEAASNGQVTSDPDIIGVRRSLLAPKEASDIYGHRLGKRYIVYQARVSNFSKDFQYVVHDISVNLKPLYTSDKDQHKPVQVFQASSRELSFLRGVTEKGQDLDPRNITLHTFQGLGSVASGVSGLTPFSDVMGSAVGVFSGPFV